LFLYCEQRNQKKVPKKIKKTRNRFLRPAGVIRVLLRRITFASQTRGVAPQTMLGLVIAERQAKRLARLRVRACPQQQFNQNAQRA